MAQFFRPSADITQLLTVGTYVDIDEVSFNDSDYVSSNNNSLAQYEFRITGGVDPSVNTGHIVRVRHAKASANVAPTTGGNTQTGSYYLYQGATLIATLGSGITEDVFTTLSYTLTSIQADSITDYTDLRVRCDWPGSGGGKASVRRGAAISWAEMETPTAAASTNVNASTLIGTFSIKPVSLSISSSKNVNVNTLNGVFGLNGANITTESSINTNVLNGVYSINPIVINTDEVKKVNVSTLNGVFNIQSVSISGDIIIFVSQVEDMTLANNLVGDQPKSYK
jgi:hypothetical protein